MRIGIVMRMDIKLARQYRAGYEMAAAREADELRALTVAESWRQFNHLLGLALALGLAPAERDEESVRQRWIQLKAGHPDGG